MILKDALRAPKNDVFAQIFLRMTKAISTIPDVQILTTSYSLTKGFLCEEKMTSSEETYICKKIIKIPVILFLNRFAEEEEEEV